MIWIDASPITAKVIQVVSRRNGAVGEFIIVAMGHDRFPVDAQIPIAVGLDSPLPNPALTLVAAVLL
jgi:hypothetical protein